MKKTVQTFSVVLVSYLITSFVLHSCERLEIPELTVTQTGKEEKEDTVIRPEINENDYIRDGSYEHPYTVNNIQELGQFYEIYDTWIEGYIVGWINGTSYPSGARFEAESASQTNLLLADSIFEKDPKNCIPIQLPATFVREELNLENNPKNLRRHIKLKGDITTYFRVTGIKNTSAYEWLGSSAMEDEALALSIIELNEYFSSYEPGMPLNQSEKWSTHSSSYTNDWKIGSYSNERFATICHTDTFMNHTFEYWLISPPINFKRIKKAVLNFDTMYNNWDGNSKFSVLLMKEKEYNPQKILTILQVRTACPELVTENQWLPSGNITLNSFSGVYYLAFRYKGIYTGKRNTTFCIDNIKLQDTAE